MKQPLYKADGTWSEFTIEVPEQSPEERYEDFLFRIGYDRNSTNFAANLFDELMDDVGVDLWIKRSRAAADVPEYYVELKTRGRFFGAHAETLPGALELVARGLPIAESLRRMETMCVIDHAIRRAFEAWHQHDLDAPCDECNASGMRRQRRREELLKQAKREQK